MLNRSIKYVSSSAGVFLAYSLFSLAATTAQASDSFPSKLRETADMACTPRCIICHTTEPGESGTATQPFAESMRAEGLVARDDDSLVKAYAALSADTDSDEDDIPDKEELTSEPTADPSEIGVGSPCEAEIAYGCGAHVAPQPPAPNSWKWPLLLSVLSLLLLWRSIFRRGV